MSSPGSPLKICQHWLADGQLPSNFSQESKVASGCPSTQTDTSNTIPASWISYRAHPPPPMCTQPKVRTEPHPTPSRRGRSEPNPSNPAPHSLRMGKGNWTYWTDPPPHPTRANPNKNWTREPHLGLVPAHGSLNTRRFLIAKHTSLNISRDLSFKNTWWLRVASCAPPRCALNSGQ